MQIVKSKGLSAEPGLCKVEKAMEYEVIYHMFRQGIYKVPCARLEYKDFDESLNTKVQNAIGRRHR